jgi:hypothetical protein
VVEGLAFTVLELLEEVGPAAEFVVGLAHDLVHGGAVLAVRAEWAGRYFWSWSRSVSLVEGYRMLGNISIKL